MIRVIIYIFIVQGFLISSFYDRNITKTYPEVEEIRDKISQISNGKLGKNKYFKFNFKREDSNFLGRCHLYSGIITINENYWETLTRNDKVHLIAHELYHCECLSLGHDNRLDSENICPKSYMYPSQTTQSCASFYNEVYLNQIKKGCDFDYKQEEEVNVIQ